METDINKIPRVRTNFGLLTLPMEKPGPFGSEACFFVFSAFLRKVLVLGVVVAMYEVQIRI